MRWLDSITKLNEHEFEQLWETVEDRGAWHAAVHEIAKSWTPMTNLEYINH